MQDRVGSPLSGGSPVGAGNIPARLQYGEFGNQGFNSMISGYKGVKSPTNYS